MIPHMKVLKDDEAGYKSALKGLSYNKKQSIEKMPKVAEKLAFADGGHNKFLESIYLWLETSGPRYFWQEADTYRLSSRQSESTMHTLIKDLGYIDESFLDVNIDEVAKAIKNDEHIKSLFECAPSDAQIKYFRELVEAKDLLTLKSNLPEGFIQKRMWCMSYKTLRNIINQRKNHRLPHWQMFIKQALEQVDHPELLPEI